MLGPNKSLQLARFACWTAFKSRFCGFAAQKYSTKPQLKNCRLARRYTGSMYRLSTKVKLVFLGQSGENSASKRAGIILNWSSLSLPNVGGFITLKVKCRFLSWAKFLCQVTFFAGNYVKGKSGRKYIKFLSAFLFPSVVVTYRVSSGFVRSCSGALQGQSLKLVFLFCFFLKA